MNDPSGQKKSRWIIPGYLLLLALLIPWYWPEDDARLLFGFPLWAIASLVVLFLISLLTAWLCLGTDESE